MEKNGKYFENSATAYYENGVLHRTDGPAIDRGYGTGEWYKEGKLHREDGPAVDNIIDKVAPFADYFYHSRRLEWYKEGKLHNDNAPAAVQTFFDVSQKVVGTSQEWYKEGQRHREEGPAIERTTGQNEWFLNDTPYSEKEFHKEINKRKNPQLSIIESMREKFFPNSKKDNTLTP